MKRGLLVLLCAGCHNMSPPPLVMRHQGAQPDQTGDLRVQLVVGFSAGILSVDPGYGFLLQSTYQTDENWKAGGSLGVGFNGARSADHNHYQHPLWLLAGRLFGRYHPDFAQTVASEAGLGLGYTSNQTLYLTTDVGGTFGGRSDFYTEAGDLFLYAAPSLAASFPLRRGLPVREPKTLLWGDPPIDPPPPVDRYVRPTWFVSLSLGGLAEGAPAGDSYGGSLELHSLFAGDGRDGSFSMGISGGPSVKLAD